MSEQKNLLDASARVEQAASNNVDGYLRNALRRVRAPAEEGGRGTRRRLEMVTSMNVATEGAALKDEDNKPLVVDQKVKQVVVDDEGDEWDVVEVAAAQVPAEFAIDLPAKGESACRESPSGHAKAEGVNPKGESGVKFEEGRPARLDDEIGGAPCGEEGDGFEMQWARPTLTSVAPSNTLAAGRQRAVAREMEEEREAAKAKEKSERILRVASKVTELVVVMQRFTRVVRESCNVHLWRDWLRIRRNHQPVIASAVAAAKASMAAAAERPPVPSLVPCWVTSKSDTVENETSRAISLLIDAIKSCGLVLLPVPAAATHPPAAEHAEDETGDALRFHPLEVWHPGTLRRVTTSLLGNSLSEEVPSPVYVCIVFLLLCHLSKMEARLVVAWDPSPPPLQADAPEAPSKQKLMTTVPPKEAKQRKKPSGTRHTPASSDAPLGGSQVDPAATTTAKVKLPESYCWCEVWCPIRQSWISVNPCAESVRVVWNCPYVLAFGRGGTIVDVTPRYSSKYSTVLAKRLDGKEHSLGKHYLWRGIAKDDARSYLDVLLVGRKPTDRFGGSMAAAHRWHEREHVQLQRLMYAEPVPNTLGALKRDPLYVVEQDVGRWEGIFPKDKTTIVGCVRGHAVYKRSAVVSLRSRDGWLRLHRSLRSGDEVPYKAVPPPPSRPFGPHSHFFGRWQTVPFEPRPLREDGSIETHGNSSWYILLRGSAPPAGIVHIVEPLVARVARKMKVEFAHAVVAFVKRHASGANRRGTWDAQIEGIVVPASKAAAVTHAYKEWVEITALEAAAKRRQRALKWWAHLIQQRLAVHRLETLYEEGQRRRKHRRVE